MRISNIASEHLVGGPRHFRRDDGPLEALEPDYCSRSGVPYRPLPSTSGQMSFCRVGSSMSAMSGVFVFRGLAGRSDQTADGMVTDGVCSQSGWNAAVSSDRRPRRVWCG
jgi:hypothetical protein